MSSSLKNAELAIEKPLQSFISAQDADSAHDLCHIQRVVTNAKRIGKAENANLEVVIPAAWLHDCVVIPKSSPDRPRASLLSADRAIELLSELNYPPEHHDAIHHAIKAHSYSAGHPCETLEAKVVQDADRLDALGAIGLTRCLMVGEQLSLNLYSPDDPFCEQREPDDQRFIVDHFYRKLLDLPGTMQTSAGKMEATNRVKYLQDFLDQLRVEIQ